MKSTAWGVIVVLLALVIWLSVVIVRLENFRYATQVGFCSDPSFITNTIKRYECLKAQETRTSPFWHLFYALKGDF